MKIFKKLLLLLTPQELKLAALLLVMITIMAILDMIGVASILPFVANLTNPSLIQTNFILSYMFQLSNIFGVQDTQQFLIVLGSLFFILLVISLAFNAITTYAIIRFVRMREYSIGKRLVEGYLRHPYSWFLNRHSSELGKNILSEVAFAVGQGIIPFMELISKGMVATALIVLLIIVDPKIALIVGFTLGIAYSLIFYLVHKHLKQIGNERTKNNQSRFLTVSEAFSAIKEVKVIGLEQAYINRFSDPARKFAKNVASSKVIAQLPRFILEAIAFGGIVVIILYMMSQTSSFNSILPIFSLYIFAGYRLLPALQSIYASLTSLTFVDDALDKLNNDLENLKSSNLDQDQRILSFNKAISLKNIHYNYPNASKTSLKDISLNIPVKSTIGLIGATGSGKTTTVDIILGLLEAQKGTLEVDGKIITKQNSRSWQRSIGYVPQHIYLADDTVAANIAFGVNYQNINQEVVEKVSKIANLHNFVIEELFSQYQTPIGERGVRLSGGQRQRIGIARALYHNPKVLILDEATSALDNQTEKVVMDAVNNISKDITIILIAHRLNTVKNCDQIFKLDKGKIVSKGTFDELINENKNFTSH